jgi:hypothetical protein
VGYPDRGQKNFLELGTRANRFLVPENPEYQKISQFGAKIKKLKKLIFNMGFLTPIGVNRGSKNFLSLKKFFRVNIPNFHTILGLFYVTRSFFAENIFCR